MLNAQIAELQMLRFAWFSQFDGAQFPIVLYIDTLCYRKSHDTFYSLTQETVQTFFRQVLPILDAICRSLILNPKKQTEQSFYEMVGAQGFRFYLEVLKGMMEHLHIHWLFLPLVFENSNVSFIEYSTVTFGVDPCALYRPDIANTRGRYMLAHAVTLRSDC